MIFLIDIDGTLADNSHRTGFIQSTEKDWDSFYDPELVRADKPIWAAQQALSRLVNRKGNIVHLLTGRPKRLREVTSEWMRAHFDISPVEMESSLSLVHGLVQLHMRSDKDYRPAHVYKERLLSEVWSLTKLRPILIDDDLRNEEMYNRYGLFLHAPGCWDFIR